MPARGWGRDGRDRETYVDGDDVECVPPVKDCARCGDETRDPSPLALCKRCRGSNQWRLR